MKRRALSMGFLARCFAVWMIGCSLQTKPLAPDPGEGKAAIPFSSGFVRADGTRFSLDGRPFFFQGTNFHQAALNGYYTEEALYDIMGKLAGRGLKVVRLWGFGCLGQVSREPMIRAVSKSDIVYDEAGFRKLDVAIDAARAAGIKLIVALVNYEPDYCGMDWWVRQIKNVSDRQLFLFDRDVIDAFKRHVAVFLNRENSRYAERFGVKLAYKDDPTIMAIEMANEPHTVDAYERALALPPGELVHRWLAELTEHVRSIDRKHLISTGEEGYQVTYSPGPYAKRHSWINDGLKGVSFERNIALPNVDFATVHIYPDNLNIPSSDMWWIKEYLFADRARIAHAQGKPILLEETGFNPTPSPYVAGLGYARDIPGFLRAVYDFANEAGFAGTMIWQCLPTGYASGGMEFNYDSPSFAVLEEQIRCMESLGQGQNDCAALHTPVSMPCTDTPPDSYYTCAQQAGWGKCAEPWMAGFCDRTCGRCS